MKIAINGFGRIGRQVLRICIEHAPQLEVQHINDVADGDDLAHLLQYDSTYGIWDRKVRGTKKSLIVDGREIPVSSEKDPGKLPWKAEEIDIVLESTGKFRKREEAALHLKAGAAKVLVSAPGKSPLDGDFVMGVNEETYDPERHHIISIGSCTTNCLAPMVKVLHDEFSVLHGFMTTVHAYTASQNLQDGPHKDIRRARAAAENIVPTSTGAAESIGKIIPALQGKLDGMAMRVPVSCGSITDLTCVVEKETSVEEVNEKMRERSEARMKGILGIAPAPMVSSDIIGNSHSCIFSSEDTLVKDGTLIKALGWYDNEWAFSRRCVDMLSSMM